MIINTVIIVFSCHEQGQDDLRQDAVMQQVFSMCSMLLQRNADTRKRKLNIRRYKVETHHRRCDLSKTSSLHWPPQVHTVWRHPCLDSQVVPFSQRSGVLEWCSGTVPIGEFLVEPNKGAHKRFRPQDWTNLACRKKMMVLRWWECLLEDKCLYR